MLVTGAIDPGGFLTFFRALGRLAWPLMALGFLIGLVQRGRAAYSRLTDILLAQPDIVGGDHAPPARLDGRLTVKDLRFAYDQSRPILQGVSFELEPGASLAIVGRTGSGKSTLARLLPRLMNVPRGSVFGKVMSNMQEIKARRGPVIAVCSEADREVADVADDVIPVPDMPEYLQPIVCAVPLVLLRRWNESAEASRS
jgi:ABC-type multidrug transport system fused ATPase/permease subunit